MTTDHHTYTTPLLPGKRQTPTQQTPTRQTPTWHTPTRQAYQHPAYPSSPTRQAYQHHAYPSNASTDLPGKPPNQTPCPSSSHDAQPTRQRPTRQTARQYTPPNSLPGDPPTTHIPGKRSSPHLAYPANLAMRRPLPHGWTYPAKYHLSQPAYPANTH